MIKAYLFDFDYTLVDSSPAILEALEANRMSELFTLIIGGDSLFDYYAAQNAGVQFKAVLNGATTEAEFMAHGCKKEDIMVSLGELMNN